MAFSRCVLVVIAISITLGYAAVTMDACKAKKACSGTGITGNTFTCGAGNGLSAPNGVSSCSTSSSGSCPTSCNATATSLATTAATNNLNSNIGYYCGTVDAINAACTSAVGPARVVNTVAVAVVAFAALALSQ